VIAVPLPLAEIRHAAGDAAFVAAMQALYAELDAGIAARSPVCTNRGACCKFGAYGHSLFVTSAELAYFLATSEGPLRAPPDRSFCAYQVEGKCTARTARPAGCRVYFCDANSTHWQPELTEQTLRRLAALGEEHGIPYAYGEWTDGLRALGGAPMAARSADPSVTIRPLR
jgi:hypothetical protein